MSVILNMPAGFINHVDIHFMPLYFSEILTEASISDVVPLRRFHRVMNLSGCDINLFRSGDDISSSDIIYEPPGRLKWYFREG